MYICDDVTTEELHIHMRRLGIEHATLDFIGHGKYIYHYISADECQIYRPGDMPTNYVFGDNNE